jgi:hypothetical protein
VRNATIGTRLGTAGFPSIRFMVEADLRGWLPLMGVALTEGQIERILHDAEHELSAHVSAAGTMTFDLGAHLVTAIEP